jgi:hypothetical protein
MPTEYRIIVKGHLADHWSTWFDNLTISNGANGEAMLVGRLEDQAALYGVLVKLRDLGVPLISLQPVLGAQPDHIG